MNGEKGTTAVAAAGLGTLTPVPLRDVWPNEESDFTPWLAKDTNLGILGDELGMSLELLEREARVGPYEADLVCRDTNDGAKVVVENQLGQTDHDHLGKVLTYAAHFGAKVAVWVARSFTEQHREAVDWLNEIGGGGTRFFAVEIELWKIGESSPAPRLNVVAGPRGMDGGGSRPSLSETQRFRLEFWEGFRDFVSRNGEVVTKTQTPRTDHWLPIAGVRRTGFFIVGIASIAAKGGGHELRAELQISGGDADHHFNRLKAHQPAIEDQHEFEPLEWHNPEGVQQRRIYWRLSTNIEHPDGRTDQYRWLLERAEALHRLFADRIRNLPAPEETE